MNTKGFQRLLVLMLIVQPAGAAQRTLPVPLSIPTSGLGLGAGLPAIQIPHGIGGGFTSPLSLSEPAAPDSRVPDPDTPALPVLPVLPVSPALQPSLPSLPAQPSSSAQPHAADQLRAASPNDQSNGAADSASNSGEQAASDAGQPFDGGGKPSQPVDPPFYGRQKPAAERARTRVYTPTPADTERARSEYLVLAERGEEVFNAPTWFEKVEHPELKKAVFSVAMLDEALTDIANGQNADIPVDLQGDVVSELLLRRAKWMAVYHVEIARIQGELEKNSTTAGRAKNNARLRLENWHQLGLVAPALDRPIDKVPPDYQDVARAYQKVRDIAAGRVQSSSKEVNALAKLYETRLRSTLLLRKARALDMVLGAARANKAAPGVAKAIYDRSIREARDSENAFNLDHASARMASLGSTVLWVPRSGKQIRPTCTMHMLASMLATLGVKRDLTELIKEARLILGDPYIGITTAFNYEQQLKLFRHYGRMQEVRSNIFESLIVHHRPLKISIEIGDPIYKHSLILAGFYEMYGVTYVALVDSTSYFPTYMTVEDFARILTADDAVLFLEAFDQPLP